MPEEICYGQPVNWSHAANRGLTNWWIGLPWYGSGPRMIDIAGKTRAPGTFTNTVGWGAGPGEFKAPDFSTSNGWINCGTVTSTSGLIALGVLLNCRSTQASAPNIRNIAGPDGAGGARYMLRLGDSGAPTLVEWVIGVSGEKKVTASTAMPLNEWVYLLGWYDGVNQVLYQWGLLSGGGQVATSARTGAISTGETTMAIGATNNAQRPFDGRIASVQLWQDSVPTPAIAMKEALTGFPNMLSRYSLDDLYGQAAAGAKVPWGLFGRVA